MIKKKADKANLLFFSNSAIEKLESEIDTVLKLLRDGRLIPVKAGFFILPLLLVESSLPIHFHQLKSKDVGQTTILKFLGKNWKQCLTESIKALVVELAHAVS